MPGTIHKPGLVNMYLKTQQNVSISIGTNMMKTNVPIGKVRDE